MNGVAPRLAEWAAMWRTALPGFEVDSTWGGPRARWSPVDRRKLEGDIHHRDSDDDLAFDLLGLPSPDGRYVLNVDSYQSIVPEGDTLVVGGEPDSQPLLIDGHAKVEAVLEFCGTGCGFHWGTWLSPKSFALAGWRDADDYGQWKQGWVSIYSIRDSTALTYVTRIVSAEAFSRYLSAWEGWLMGRYRVWKASRPRS